MRRSLAAILLAGSFLATVAAHAAAPAAPAPRLHSLVVLDGAQVRLSDLFAHAGPNATQLLGPAPPPGGQFVVGARQLAAIAQEFAVAWHPVSPGEQVVVRRRGQVLPLGLVRAALRHALAADGAPGDLAVTLNAYAPPMLPADGPPSISIRQFSYDPDSGAFGALIAATTPLGEPQEMRVTGTAQAMLALVVPRRRIMPGELIDAADLRHATLPANRAGGAVAVRLAQLVGLTARRMLMPGTPVPLDEVAPPNLVEKDSPVLIGLSLPGIALTATGQALEDGSLGARIRVLNPVSRAVLLATVTGVSQVRVEPGSAPLVPPVGGLR